MADEGMIPRATLNMAEKVVYWVALFFVAPSAIVPFLLLKKIRFLSISQRQDPNDPLENLRSTLEDLEESHKAARHGLWRSPSTHGTEFRAGRPSQRRRWP